MRPEPGRNLEAGAEAARDYFRGSLLDGGILAFSADEDPADQTRVSILTPKV